MHLYKAWILLQVEMLIGLSPWVMDAELGRFGVTSAWDHADFAQFCIQDLRRQAYLIL